MLDQSVWPERVDRRVSLLCFQKPRERGTEEDPIPCSDQGPQWQPLSTGGVGASLWEAPRVKCTSPWPRSRGVMTATKDLLFSGYFQAINMCRVGQELGALPVPPGERERGVLGWLTAWEAKPAGEDSACLCMWLFCLSSSFLKN